MNDAKPLEAVPPQPVQPQAAQEQSQTPPDQPWYDDVKGSLKWVDLAAAFNGTGQFLTRHTGTQLAQGVLTEMLPKLVAEPAVAALGFAASAPVALAAAFVIGGIELYEHRKEIWDATRHGPLAGQTITDNPAYKAISGSGGQIFA